MCGQTPSYRLDDKTAIVTGAVKGSDVLPLAGLLALVRALPSSTSTRMRHGRQRQRSRALAWAPKRSSWMSLQARPSLSNSRRLPEVLARLTSW
jgi:hypothetical protein